MFADDKNCPICLKNFEQDDIVNSLPCKHRFHSECIKQWLQKVTKSMYIYHRYGARAQNFKK